jgi:hypothetical protein
VTAVYNNDERKFRSVTFETRDRVYDMT